MTLGLFELLFLIWILYFMEIYLNEGFLGIVVLSLIIISILYHDFRIFLSDKVYLRCTVEGFFYKPHPKKDGV